MGSEDKHGEESLGIGLKVMVAVAFSLFGMILLIIIFHFSVKYIIIRRQQRRRQNDLLLYQMTTQIAPIDGSSLESRNSGLDPFIIASLPKLLYKQTEQFNQGEILECSICLGTIVEDTITRVLPNCKHIFHVDCVDKWFCSNTTCPICRTVVTPAVQPEHSHLVTRVNQIQPTAPLVVGGDELQDSDELEKVRCSGLRIGSFHRMVSNRERSGSRTQSCDESTIEDIERH